MLGPTAPTGADPEEHVVFRRNRLTGKTEAADTQESGNALSRRFEDGDDSPTVLLDNPNDAAAETPGQ